MSYKNKHWMQWTQSDVAACIADGQLKPVNFLQRLEAEKFPMPETCDRFGHVINTSQDKRRKIATARKHGGWQ